jgi:hypothetical protein
MEAQSSVSRERQVLLSWERAVGLDRWRREDALLSNNGVPPRGLGARNSALLDVRNTLFDRAWPLKSHCPACGAQCEFEIDSQVLAEDLNRHDATEEAIFEWAGRSFSARAPTVDDVRAIASHQNVAGAKRALLARCLSGDIDVNGVGDAEIEELGRYLERLDTRAAVSFALRCPTCDHGWSAAIDIAEALWTELQRAAEWSLVEIDTLARAYGWTEDEVLRLSPARRAAYLQLAEGA